jgi:hypothetical protein
MVQGSGLVAKGAGFGLGCMLRAKGLGCGSMVNGLRLAM